MFVFSQIGKRMNFYLANLNTHTINKDEASHFFTMRLKVGDEVQLTDLRGQLQKVKISYVDKKSQKIAWEVLHAKMTEQPIGRALFQASTDKGYLEKLSEVLAFSGFTEIYLYQAERTPKQNINLDRLNKILIRGCELAELSWMPKIEILHNEAEFEEMLRIHTPVVLEQQNIESKAKIRSKPKACLVGPEGGWSQKEHDLFHILNLPFQTLGAVVFPSWLAGFAWDQRQN